MAAAPSNLQLPRNSLPVSGKLAKRNPSASAARHHWRAREAEASSGGSTSSSSRGAGMLSPYPFPLREASNNAAEGRRVRARVPLPRSARARAPCAPSREALRRLAPSFDGERTIDSRHFRHALRRRASARAASSRGVRGIAWRGLKVGAGERFARLRNSRAGARLNPARHRRSACGEDQRATARAPSSHCAGVRRRMINALHGCRVLRYGRGESNLDP